MTTELVRDISSSRRFLWFIRGRKNYYFGVWTDPPVRPVRSEETLSWVIRRLRHCDPRKAGIWEIAMKLCTCFGKRLGTQGRDFSDCYLGGTGSKSSRGSGIFQSCFRMPRSYHGIISRYLRVPWYILFWLEIMNAKVFYRKRWSNLGW